MRIVLLTNQVDVGGIEQNIVRLSSTLVARGHQVNVVSRGGALVKAIERAGATHVSLGGEHGAGFLREVKEIRRAIRVVSPDVVHVFSASMNVRLQLALPWLDHRPKVVSSIMGLQTSPSEGTMKIRLRALLTTIRVDRLLVMAPAIDEVVAGLPISDKRIEHMSAVGIELPSEGREEARRWARAEIGVPQDRVLVMTIGRLDASKSHELFVEAAIRICEATPEAACVIVGGGVLLDDLRRRIPADLEDRIRLLGERLDASRLVAASDIYVRPGIVEGFVGITVLEAQAWGIPVVAFETRDVRLAIAHRDTGWLVSNGDPQALARGVLHLVDHPEEASAIGKAGRESVERDFSIGSVCGDLERVYESLVLGGAR